MHLFYSPHVYTDSNKPTKRLAKKIFCDSDISIYFHFYCKAPGQDKRLNFQLHLPKQNANQIGAYRNLFGGTWKRRHFESAIYLFYKYDQHPTNRLTYTKLYYIKLENSTSCFLELNKTPWVDNNFNLQYIQFRTPFLSKNSQVGHICFAQMPTAPAGHSHS